MGTECDRDPTMRDNNVYRQKPHKYFILISLNIQERERERALYHFYMLHASIHSRKHKEDKGTPQTRERKKTPFKAFFFLYCAHHKKNKDGFLNHHMIKERETKKEIGILEKNKK